MLGLEAAFTSIVFRKIYLEIIMITLFLSLSHYSLTKSPEKTIAHV